MPPASRDPAREFGACRSAARSLPKPSASLLGLLGALAFCRLVVRFLFATPPTDPLTYSAVGAVFALAALLALLGPARRATAVAPQVAFRTE